MEHNNHIRIRINKEDFKKKLKIEPPTKEELLDIIKPLIPEVKYGEKGENGENGKDGSPDTPEQIIQKISGMEKALDWKILKNVPDLFVGKNKGAYGIGYMREIADVSLTNLADQQVLKWNSTTGKWENGTVSSGGGSETFETVSKNLKAYPYTISYSGGNIDYITYNLGGGLEIVKTFGYTSGDVTSVTLSGDTPAGIDLTKTISYSGGNIDIINYL